MTWLFIVLSITGLILINALYVSAEFSAVSSRRSRLSRLASDGNPLAKTMLEIVTDTSKLDTFVASCQVGITASSLILGYYGQSQVATAVAPFFMQFGKLSQLAAQSVATTVVLLILTALQALIGELVPKNIGLQYPEKLALATILPMRWSISLFKPLIWVFNGSGHALMRLFKLHALTEHMHVHSPHEIMILVEESSQGGLLPPEERHLLRNTLQMRDTVVRQVMKPRTQILAAPDSLPPGEMLKLIADSPYSRIPVYKKNIDDIAGLIHLKDLLCIVHSREGKGIKSIVRPVPFIPETMPTLRVFSLLQRMHYHIAIVLDEFGGTAGMVTLEDLIEEIFGELQDEFDTETPSFRLLPGNRLWIRGDTLLADLNELFSFELPEEDIDTIGGLLLSLKEQVPTVGDSFEFNGLTFRVEEMLSRRVAAVSLVIDDDLAKTIREGDYV